MYASLVDHLHARVLLQPAIERKRALSAPSAPSRDAMAFRRYRNGRRAQDGSFLARQRVAAAAAAARIAAVAAATARVNAAAEAVSAAEVKLAAATAAAITSMASEDREDGTR